MKSLTERTKFQYLHGENFYDEFDPFYETAKKLCVSISTDIIKENNRTYVFWSYAFKRPDEQFSKVVAREVLLDAFEKNDINVGELILSAETSRNEIVFKILCQMMYDSVEFPNHYKTFVRTLFDHYSFLSV